MAPTIDGLTDLAEIGRGGFGVVYRASQPAFERTVAVKVITGARLDADAQHRFERECRATGALSSHPNIVGVHGSGRTDEGDPFYVMDHLTGGSLAQRVRARGPLDENEAIALGISLAGALETAHRAGIIHRDVKPENVLFSDYGVAVLVDFGIARMAAAWVTQSGTISASVAHAAPEILGGAPSTPAADVYALASVLHFALAGAAPFHRDGEDSLTPMIARIATADPPDLTEIGVSAPLSAAISAAMSKDPATRPVSARDFGQALSDAAEAVGGHPPTIPLPVMPPTVTDDLAAATTPHDLETAKRSPTEAARSEPQSASSVFAAAPVGASDAPQPDAPQPDAPSEPPSEASTPDPSTTGAVSRDRRDLAGAAVDDETGRRRNRWWVAAAVLAVFALIGAAAFALTRDDDATPVAAGADDTDDSDDSDDARTTSSTTTEPDDTTTTDTTEAESDPEQPVDDTVPEGTGGSTGPSGGPDGSGGSGGAVAPTPQPEPGPSPQPEPTPEPEPTPQVVAPGAPSAASVGSPEPVDYSGGVPQQVRVSLAWSPPTSGSSPTNYIVRCTLMVGSNVYTGSASPAPCKGGIDVATVGNTTSTSVTVSRVEPGPGTWVKWEIRAKNQAGAGSSRVATVVVPDLRDYYSWEAYPLGRVVGLAVVGNTTTCQKEAYRICSQTVSAGSTRTAGAAMTLVEQSA